MSHRAYCITAAAFAITAVIMFAIGYPFVGTLAIAGMGLSGSAILRDNLPEDRGDDDTDYNSYQ